MKEWGMDPEAMKFKEGQDEQNTTSLRTYMTKWFEEIKKQPFYVDKLEKCTHSTFLVKYSNVCLDDAMSIILLFSLWPCSGVCPHPRGAHQVPG